jgi:hypothetical protein
VKVALRLLVLLVIVGVAVLTPLAYASPPDPLWLGGYWDDDDFDSVVIFVTGHIHALAVARAVDHVPLGALAWLPQAPDPECHSEPPRTAVSRGPPLPVALFS